MKHQTAKIIITLLAIVTTSFAARNAIPLYFDAKTIVQKANKEVEHSLNDIPADTIHFPVKQTVQQNLKSKTSSSTDLKDPENLTTGIFYDENTGTYQFGTKLGENWISTPLMMTEEDVNSSFIHQSFRDFFRKKNAEDAQSKGKEKFDFTDMKFDLGPASKIFGPGGVRIKTQGTAELKLGANTRAVDNPSLSERNRKVFGFDFDEKINLSVNGNIGDKMGMEFNYNSDATFNFDAQKLKLQYEGKEDEIVKLIEAGNVSMPTNNSLVRGATSLFGVRTDLQFGKLKLQTILAQKKSSTQSVKSNGGVQLSNFEFSADDYDERRHFFLAHFFRDNYDKNMAQLPNILSGVTINRVEIWVTNKTGQTTNTRNIIAFTDLGENIHTKNSLWSRGSIVNPSNNSNTLYSTLTSSLSGARDIATATTILDGYGLRGGTDYEKLESARLLSPSEYILNKTLGYISLKSTLQTDQVLAIAFEYTFRGTSYQVGEFSTDMKNSSSCLFVKSLKNTANTPEQGNWDLMMKNVYSLGASNVQKDKFRLDIKYLSDTTGVYLNYLPINGLKDKKIIQLIGLDRLDNNNKRNPNAYFDFVEGYTIDSENGRVFFTSVEPFGSNLEKVIGNTAIAKKFVFQELYDSTKTIAKQIAEKDKFLITGQYKASREDEISLGAINVPRGSVIVTAGGARLVEGSDYTVDYYSGTVKILNKSLLDAGTPINVSLESDTEYGLQRKTLWGLNWQYDFSRNFMLGGTVMHLSEKPLTTKVSMGSEALNNTIWGLNMAYKNQSQWLTNLFDKLPLIHLTEPSSINFSAEFAQLIAGKNKGTQGNASYIDDFENTSSNIDISNPKDWVISSTPSMFSESQLNNDIRYGYNRALIAWYYIDPLFTRRNSSLTPSYIKGDLAQLSDPDVREVPKSDLFPNKAVDTRESNYLNIFNIAYYPSERGPYNLDPNLDINGHLLNPKQRWGGLMRSLDQTDFETSNIEYIEFWLQDPFIKARQSGTTFSGDLYFNLGEISEDILKDGKKFYESGMPIDGNSSLYTETAWGRIPSQTSVTYAFNTASGARERQDVGFNGLTSAEEATFPAYRQFLDAIKTRVSASVYESIAAAPSADKYHYFRGSDYDKERKTILERYKYINNPNGNSADANNSPESYSTAYKTTPDAEDINADYTMNEYEKYYQYHVSISPNDMVVGKNFIVDSRVTNSKLRDGSSPEITWYLFRIPVESYERNVGGISDFSSIRFIRMFLTGFEKPVVLRLGTFNLIRGDWRAYEQPLYTNGMATGSGTLEPSSVNFEENNEKQPVNYVIPPGISRVVDPGNDQLLQNNEQSLALTVRSLSSGAAKAVYKNTNLDLRKYKHIQMFSHANSLAGSPPVSNGQISIFIRLGSDYKSNFYEYEIPLTVTQPKLYPNSNAGALQVWPVENMLDIDLTTLTMVKRNRNKQKSLGLASYGQLYSEYDTNKPANKISIMGNPTLGDIRTVMIGVRNNSRDVQDVEVWANELRLQNFNNKGGWAAQAALNIKLSDLATVDLSSHVETEGFGGIEESVSQRRDNNLYEYNVTTNVQLGKLLPEKAKLNAPLYYSYSKEKTVPHYNPLDSDMPMDEALRGLTTKTKKEELEAIADKVVKNRNFSLTGVRFNITTHHHPMPYDPANFSFSYAHSSRETTGETTAWEKDQNWKWNINYNYSPNYRTFEPFKKFIKSRSQWWQIFKRFGLNYLPQNIGFNSDITRAYYELQERDLENLDNQSLPLTWNSDFLWNRSFQLRWDLTKNLHLNFNSGTNAEIVQPYTAVNKDLYPDRYRAWKDSVWQSLRGFGTPLNYAQSFDASWRLPINLIPLFDWLTLDASYKSSYAWVRGTELEDGTSLGNTINMGRDISANARFNMETLYNHIPFLKNANRKFSALGNSRPNQQSKKNNENKPKSFEREIQLKTDTTVTVQHNQKTKKFTLTALSEDGRRIKLQYKILDADRILILTRDSAKIKLTVTPKKKAQDKAFYDVGQYVARGLMMVRNVSANYSNKYNMSLPGFLPNIGDFFGQASNKGLRPGLDFAFGLIDDDYIRRVADRNWLLMSDSIITPATTSLTEDWQFRATLEPFRDFKIDLTATRNTNRTRSIQYMYSGMPIIQTGSFTQTTISINSAFESYGNARNGYNSKTFRKFLASLPAFREQVESQYIGSTYPSGSSLSGQTFNSANGTVNSYSADVMIPAFLKAYTASSDRLQLFPTLRKILPNWSISYGGLSRLNAMKKVFRSFNLNHSYKSIFSVGAYNSYTSWMQYMGLLGFVNDVTTGLPTPSSQYDIAVVSLNESFSPLIGVDMTFLNNLSARLELRKTRVVALSMTNQQINESRSNDIVLGVGYKVNNLNLFQPKRTVKSKHRRGTAGNKENTQQTTANIGGFSNDLNIRFDFSFRNQAALNRDILTGLTQATSGNKSLQISFTVDYTLSKFLTLTAYYNRQTNNPLLTSSSYPTTTQDFGLSFKFLLNH